MLSSISKAVSESVFVTLLPSHIQDHFSFSLLDNFFGGIRLQHTLDIQLSFFEEYFSELGIAVRRCSVYVTLARTRVGCRRILPYGKEALTSSADGFANSISERLRASYLNCESCSREERVT